MTRDQLDYFYVMNLNRLWPFNFIFLYFPEIQYHCMFNKKVLWQLALIQRSQITSL